MELGILVGGDSRQEWLLPWWWEKYTRHNDYPVTFVDFGLSKEKKQWCEKRGNLISLRFPPLFVKDAEEVDPTLRQSWEERYPDGFWDSRSAWFKKAGSCLASPYEKTVWIDLDCEIVRPLQGIEKWADLKGIAMALDVGAPSLQYPVYNSGVIVFRKNHPLIEEWAKQSLCSNHRFRSDQDLLSWIIADKGFELQELPPLYNWGIGYGEQDEVVIYHWMGDAAKSALRNRLILEQLNS